MQYLVRSGGLLGFPELVQELGGSPGELLDAVGLSPALLRDPDLYASFIGGAELLTLAAQRCHAPDFGVRLACRQGLEVVGALASWLCLQATLGEALHLLQKNLGFHARGIHIEASVESQAAALDLHFDFEAQTDCTQLASLSLAQIARCIAQLHGTALVPLAVTLKQPRPADISVHRAAFRCQPAFGQPRNRLVYPLTIFAMPVQVAAALRERLSTQWRSDWQQRQPASLHHQAERAITALLPTGDCSLERVARMVELHPRVLQQRLRRESLSFGVILQQVRERLAREYLADSDIDLTSLAMNLGFGELAIFSRAFKRWTGSSPRHWRMQRRGASTEIQPAIPAPAAAPPPSPAA